VGNEQRWRPEVEIRVELEKMWFAIEIRAYGKGNNGDRM
jgi:hypothetical protein